MIATGVALLSYELTNEHWWEVTAKDTRLDMCLFSTLAGYMFDRVDQETLCRRLGFLAEGNLDTQAAGAMVKP